MKAGARQRIAKALILMSGWCGFMPTPTRENPGADLPSTETKRRIDETTTCGWAFFAR
jgi:hypothetical protein